MRILLVEDEPGLSASLTAHLESEGFTIDCARTYRSASEAIATCDYDCILLDLGLPDGNGLFLLAEIAQQDYDPGVIVLTARNGIEDRIEGLNRGADDYLAKPFSMLELTARIHAVLRRKFKLHDNTITVDAMTLDLVALSVSVHGHEVPLTRNEFTILRYLVLNRNRIVTRIALAEHIWGNKADDKLSFDVLNSHIKNIRKKLAEAGATDCIKTVYGVGYKCEVP